MWMMGYNEGGADSFNGGGRKLRPLIPRFSSCPTSATNTNSSDHRFNALAEQNKRELLMLNSEAQHPPVMVSSRWNPTPDQLRFLEELYRQGTRTPSADHIQQITAQLRRYGKIEGKNVFYWFQNHKARERQKRRRQMETGHEDSPITTTTTTSALIASNHGFDKKDPPGYKVEHTRNWICSVGCDTQPEKPAHDHHHHEEEELENRRVVERNGRCGVEERGSFPGRYATWQMMQLPSGLYASPHHHHHRQQIILNSTNVSSSNINNTVSLAKDALTVSPLYKSTRSARNLETCDANNKDQEQHEDQEHQEQTLELFPLRKGGFVSNGGEDSSEKEKESGIHCFYEFLPLKN